MHEHKMGSVHILKHNRMVTSVPPSLIYLFYFVKTYFVTEEHCMLSFIKLLISYNSPGLV